MARTNGAREPGSFTKVERDAWLSLLATYRDVTRRMDEALQREHGLSVNEWVALLRLTLSTDADDVRMGDLAEMLMLSPSGLTRLIDRLEKDKLVERVQGSTDSREITVRVTKKGSTLFQSAMPTHDAILRAKVFDVLTAAEIDQLGRILGKVAKNDPPATAITELHSG